MKIKKEKLILQELNAWKSVYFFIIIYFLACDLLKKMLMPNPDERISISEALSHKFIQKYCTDVEVNIKEEIQIKEHKIVNIKQ